MNPDSITHSLTRSHPRTRASGSPQFLEKDATLAPKIVPAILKYWPATNSKKELMFLTELEEVLDRIQSHHLGDAQVPLFRQIGKSIQSPQFQVSERAIYVLNNDIILRFITNNREELVPILSDALYANTWLHNNPAEAKNKEALIASGLRWQMMGHWNPTIVELTIDILKLFGDMDATLMNECSTDHTQMMKSKSSENKKKREAWQNFLVNADEHTRKVAAEHQASLKIDKYPEKSDRKSK